MLGVYYFEGEDDIMSGKKMLGANEINNLLDRAPVGRLATLNSDGSPYIVPVNFVYHNSKIYIHGSQKGKKMDNIKRTPIVCFEADEMSGIIIKENRSDSCGVTTEYTSAVAFGDAKIIDDIAMKRELLQKIVEKYAPEVAHKEMPDDKIAITAIIEISVSRITGKCCRR